MRWLVPGLRASAALALGAALGLVWGGGESRAADLPPLRAGTPPYFTADLAISMDGEGRPGLSVSLTVPYPELQWVVVPHGYAGGAEVVVAIESGSGGRRGYGDTWERRVVVPTFDMTLPATSAIVESRTFRVPPGRYRARITVRDLNAETSSSVAQRFDVPDYSNVPLGFADLELGTVDSTDRFRAVPTRVFGFDVKRMAARVTVFDHRAGAWPRTYPFHYRILDDQGVEVRSGDQSSGMARSAQPAIVRPADSDLFLGSYVFEVDLTDGRSHWRTSRSFEVDESGPPHGQEFTRALEVLAIIAEGKEIEHLRALDPSQQAQGWAEFWRRRDPMAGTGRNEAEVEFFRRVHYAAQHFQGFGPGWRSDMGRIYIKFGPPDQVESGSAQNGTGAYEIWTYTHPTRRFVFEDSEGFGRFVLVSPAFE